MLQDGKEVEANVVKALEWYQKGNIVMNSLKYQHTQCTFQQPRKQEILWHNLILDICFSLGKESW
jgi:hypothetical protein